MGRHHGAHCHQGSERDAAASPPSPVVLGEVDSVGVADALVALQQHHHREERRRTGFLSAWRVGRDELCLEAVSEKLVADGPEELEELAGSAFPAPT